MKTGPSPTQSNACCMFWLGEVYIDRRSLVSQGYRSEAADSKSAAGDLVNSVKVLAPESGNASVDKTQTGVN